MTDLQFDPPTDAEYHAHEGFNQSTAWQLLSKSPRHAFEYRRRQAERQGGPDPSHSREREMGTVIHKLLLGSTVGYHVIKLNDYRTKVAQSARKDCEEAGITPILDADLARCVRTATAATEQLRETYGIELDGQSELPLYWSELSGALKCKAKLDHVSKDQRRIYDIKSGEDANPRRLVRRILDAGCPAWTLRGRPCSSR